MNRCPQPPERHTVCRNLYCILNRGIFRRHQVRRTRIARTLIWTAVTCCVVAGICKAVPPQIFIPAVDLPRIVTAHRAIGNARPTRNRVNIPPPRRPVMLPWNTQSSSSRLLPKLDTPPPSASAEFSMKVQPANAAAPLAPLLLTKKNPRRRPRWCGCSRTCSRSGPGCLVGRSESRRPFDMQNCLRTYS